MRGVDIVKRVDDIVCVFLLKDFLCMTNGAEQDVWHCQLGDYRVGPATQDHVIGAIKRGVVTRQFQVRAASQPHWVDIMEIPEFARALILQEELAAFDAPAMSSKNALPKKPSGKGSAVMLAPISAGAEDGSLFIRSFAIIMRAGAVGGAFVPFVLFVMAARAESMRFSLGVLGFAACAAAYFGGHILWMRAGRLLWLLQRSSSNNPKRFPITPIISEGAGGAARTRSSGLYACPSQWRSGRSSTAYLALAYG